MRDTREQRTIFQYVDWPILITVMALMVIGWISIYAAVYNDEHQSIFDLSQSYGKQLLWIGGAFLILVLILGTDYRLFEPFSYFFYAITLVLLGLVLLLGKEVNGAKAWFEIGGFRLQPAEFAKVATCLSIANYIGNSSLRFDKLKDTFVPVMLITAPLFFIMLQPDTGSALVYCSFIFLMYREGLSINYLLLIAYAGIVSVFALLFDQIILLTLLTIIGSVYVLFSRFKLRAFLSYLPILLLGFFLIISIDFTFNNILEPHQQDRINVLLGKETDIKGVGYNVHQSKIAIGSGGFWGKGFLEGTQTKLNFVPEQSTDFIFCTIGEEWGFVGSLVMLGLYSFLIIRIISLAELQKWRFARIYGYGVASILFFHVFINIGMTIGLLPVIGIPLPFISYGGSSMFAFTLLISIFLRLDNTRKLVLQ